MEKLNSDEKMTILMKLSANEIIQVCQTNKELSRVCGDVRYNPLWYKKIKEDFGIEYKGENGNNAYEEYKRLHILSITPIYILSVKSFEHIPAENYIFLSVEKMKNFFERFIKDFPADFDNDNPIFNVNNKFKRFMKQKALYLIDDEHNQSYTMYLDIQFINND